MRGTFGMGGIVSMKGGSDRNNIWTALNLAENQFLNSLI